MLGENRNRDVFVGGSMPGDAGSRLLQLRFAEEIPGTEKENGGLQRDRVRISGRVDCARGRKEKGGSLFLNSVRIFSSVCGGRRSG